VQRGKPKVLDVFKSWILVVCEASLEANFEIALICSFCDVGVYDTRMLVCLYNMTNDRKY
jgi:hypothetical protein